MKELLKIELERAYRSKSLMISLLIGYIIAISQIAMVVWAKSRNIFESYTGVASTYPHSVFNSWLGSSSFSAYLPTYLTIFPILATMPFAISYHNDLKKGYVKMICTRTKRSNYIVSKYLATFLSAGSAVVLPMLLNLLVTSALMPSLLPSTNGLFAPNGGGMLANVYYMHPYVYIAIYLVLYFVYGGIFASLALAGSYFIENKFLLTLFPFLVYYAIGIIAPYCYNSTIGSINPKLILELDQPYYVIEVTVIAEAFIIGILCFIVFIRKGVKNDIF